MRFLRSYVGLIFVIVIFLTFTVWVGSYLGSANRQPSSANPRSSSEPSVVESQPGPQAALPTDLSWKAKELKQFNLKLDAPEPWPAIVETPPAGGPPGVRYTNPQHDRQLLGVRVHPKNFESRVRSGLDIKSEKPLVIAGQPATRIEAARTNQPGTLQLLLVKHFGKLYEFYGQEMDFDRVQGSVQFIPGELQPVRTYKTTGCNVTVDYPDSWHSREVFGPPGSATIIGFDPKPIPEAGESSGKLQLSCITDKAAARYQANFEAFHKEVKSEKIPLAQFEALKLTGLVPADAPAAAGQQRTQVILEKDERTHIITYTSPKDSYDQDLKGLNTVLETIEFQ